MMAIIYYALLVSFVVSDISTVNAICNKYCDGRDPSLAVGDYQSVSTEIWSRKIVLHVSEADDMCWASIDNGDSEDEVWIDRSFDGGVSWSGGSKLGDTKIPKDHRGWRTLMYNIDDQKNNATGLVRACGKAGNREEIACTPWTGSKVSPKVDCNNETECAAAALMQFYDPNTGLWKTTGWWNSANALTAIIDFSQRTGSKTHRYAIANTFEKNNHSHFCNDYLDDSGWWGLAWVAAYDLTGEMRYLNAAQYVADYMYSYDDNQCGSGVWWRTQKDYKNAITNELFIKLAAAVHNRIHGDTKFLNYAVEMWNWFEKSGMINNEHLINDGLTKDCENNKQETWSYNQGVILGGLVELRKATSNSSLLDVARKIADAATQSKHLNPDGILRESCESGDCGGDGPSFKGIFVRNLGELDRALNGRPYLVYLKRNADSAIKHDKNSLNQYGLHFAGPFDKADAARQHSVLDLLVSALE